MGERIDVYDLIFGDVFVEDDGGYETFEVIGFIKPNDIWLRGEVVTRSLKTKDIVSFAYNVPSYAPVLYLTEKNK